MVRQEFCPEGGRTGCGNAQAALPKPDGFSRRPKRCDSLLPPFSGLAPRLLCLFVQPFVCSLSSAAAPSPRARQSGGREPSGGRRGGTQPQHTAGRLRAFFCAFLLSHLSGCVVDRHVGETSKTSCFFSFLFSSPLPPPFFLSKN